MEFGDKHRGSTWTVHQHNPAANFSLKRSEFLVCYRVFEIDAARADGCWQAHLDRPRRPFLHLRCKAAFARDIYRHRLTAITMAARQLSQFRRADGPPSRPWPARLRLEAT